MPWMVIWLLVMALVIAVLWRFSKNIDKIEDDTSYLYEGRRGGGFGSKFLSILLGRDHG
jgi:hypothetical protein